MGIGDLLREKQTVAGDGLSGIVIRYGESSRDPQAREGSERDGNLIGLQFRTSQLPPFRDRLVSPLLPPLKRVGGNLAVTYRRRILDSTKTRS